MRKIDFDAIQELVDRENPKPGGYVIGIVAAEDVPEKEYLNIKFDFAEGPLRGYFKDLAKTLQGSGKLNPGEWPWAGMTKKSYKEKALPFFKAFITSIESSNPGFKFNSDEKSLRGKIVGAVFSEEEFVDRTGTVRTKLVISRFTSAEKIRAGEFDVPAKKTCEKPCDAMSEPFVLQDNEDLPF